MYAVPDVEEVVAVAKELGIHLGPEEAVLYRKYLMEQLQEFDTFVQARLEEPTPPMVAASANAAMKPNTGCTGSSARAPRKIKNVAASTDVASSFTRRSSAARAASAGVSMTKVAGRLIAAFED